PAGAARDLGQQLKRSLGGAEIRHTKSGVYRDNADQSYVVKVVSLGDHLRAHHQVNVPAGEFVDQLFKTPTASRGVAIQTRDAEFRVNLFQQRLDLFGAFADVVDERPVALLAGARDAFLVAAVMADQPRVGFVVGQRHAAIRAGSPIAAT